jgi:hypothetical protein
MVGEGTDLFNIVLGCGSEWPNRGDFELVGKLHGTSATRFRALKAMVVW